jgi:hypothetical protein
MRRDGRRDLPTGITPKLRKQGTKSVPVTTADGTPVYRVRLWDPVLKRQIERTAEGLEVAEKLVAEINYAKRRPGRARAEHVRFADVAARYLVAYKVKRDGTQRPKSSLAKERTCLNVYILPALGNAWMGDLDLPELNATIRHLTLQDGTPASGSTKSTVASVLRRLFAWAREERIIPVNPALELRTGWGASVRRRVIIPSIPRSSGSLPRLTTSSRAWETWPWCWPSLACAGKKLLPYLSETSAWTGSPSRSTEPPASRAVAGTCAKTGRPAQPSEPS